MTAPRLFISYSHDNDDHKAWVRVLAERLVQNGIDVLLDQWGLSFGRDLAAFMENAVNSSDQVLIICTDTYNEKANSGKGGVGYEKRIITAEIVDDPTSEKFIPLVRNVTAEKKLPIFFGSALYVDFSKDDSFESSFLELIRHVHKEPEHKKPELGKNPFLSNSEEATNDSSTSFIVTPDQSTSFFDERVAEAFPGVRGIKWFEDPKDAVDRLCLTLQPPITFPEHTPIWWWRNGESDIRKFEKVNDSTVIMDQFELNIKRIAVVRGNLYYRTYIYVETSPSTPSGLYDYSDINDGKIHYESYVSHDGHLFNRYEWEDGAGVRNGKRYSLERDQLHTHYLTPYNFIISAFNSPINAREFDVRRDSLLNSILQGRASIEDFDAHTQALRKRT